MTPISTSLSKKAIHPTINIISVAQHKSTNMKKAINVDCPGKIPVTNLNKNGKSGQNHDKKSEEYLGIEVVIEMLNKFLIEKKMPKEKLANAIEITEEELGQLLFYKVSPELIQKVNLPLIKLYCETKF